MMKSENYHNYVIKNGKFIGKFEEMYQNVEDPWHHGDASAVEYNLISYLIRRHAVCLEQGKVLDIGCGKGAFTARLKKMMPRSQILGVDIAPTAVKKAKEKFGDLGINFKVMDIQKEYKNINERFNLILVSQIMWYILPRFQEIMNYLTKEMLKKDGYLLISQTFYKPEEQKYGKEIVQTAEDMINLMELKPIETIETNRFSNHNFIALFKKKQI